MTHARVQYKLNEDETLQVEVEWDVKDAMPDVVDEVAQRARWLFAGALGDVYAATRVVVDE